MPPPSDPGCPRSGSLSRAVFLAGRKAIQQNIKKALGREAVHFAVTGSGRAGAALGGSVLIRLMDETWGFMATAVISFSRRSHCFQRSEALGDM